MTCRCPEDDGAADHLAGVELPELSLPSTAQGAAKTDLAALGSGLLVAYVYPRTGVPGRPLPENWDDIPGARGCTPQSCAYRDALAEFDALGATVVGISAQSPAEQREFAEREHIPFPLLSDDGLRLAGELRPSHLRGRGDDALSAPDDRRREGTDRDGLLPGLPARPRRVRGARLAANGPIIGR